MKLRTPLSEEEARKLHVGDVVYIDGIVYTWRDRAFEKAFQRAERGKNPMPLDLEGAVHWHCGPITKRIAGKWVVTSAGPTVSARFTLEEARAIREWGIRLIIGKGTGIGEQAVKTMKECGAAYLSAVGGAGSLYAKNITEVKDVLWPELGMPEAIWVFKVKDFGPLLVSIDSHGNNLYAQINERIKKNLLKTYKRMNIKPGYRYYTRLSRY